MKKLLLILVLAVMCSSVARADDLSDGFKAYKKGDYDIAFMLLKPLAEKGNAAAQTLLGVMYHGGRGVIKNYKEAIEWYRKAAEKGVVIAQSRLGDFYAGGLGTKEDLKEAA